jgi:hypothetical protein
VWWGKVTSYLSLHLNKETFTIFKYRVGIVSVCIHPQFVNCLVLCYTFLADLVKETNVFCIRGTKVYLLRSVVSVQGTHALGIQPRKTKSRNLLCWQPKEKHLVPWHAIQLCISLTYSSFTRALIWCWPGREGWLRRQMTVGTCDPSIAKAIFHPCARSPALRLQTSH